MDATLMLSFLLCVLALLANPLLVAPEAVLDTDGDELKAGIEYHIVSAIVRPGGGGFTMGRNRNGTICPRAVVQEPSPSNRGRPVAFFPMDPKQEVIQVDTDLNIKFSKPATICPRSSTVWKLDDEFVTTGGVIGNYGCQTLSNWFKIEKLPIEYPFYKLVYCPSILSCGRVGCGDIGIITDNGVRRLRAFNDFEVMVIFIKAKVPNTSRIMSVANN